MIYITGDIHGDPTRFSKEAFPEQDTMTKEDYVIICEISMQDICLYEQILLVPGKDYMYQFPEMDR